MNRNQNIILSFLSGVCCVALVVFALLAKQYTFATILGVVSGLIFATFVKYLTKKRMYVNPYNLLPLSKQIKNPDAIRSTLRKNLTANGYTLKEGFYVNTTSKDYDVYFCTYTKEDVNQKVTDLCRRFSKDDEYLTSVMQSGGYTNAPMDLQNLRESLVQGAIKYQNPSTFTQSKRRYVILLGQSAVTQDRPMFSFWMLPFNNERSVDQLTFVELSDQEGIARLDTAGPYKHNPRLRVEMRKIFDKVIDFDCNFDGKTAKRLGKYID